MANRHDLDGLMKWVRREPWYGLMEEVLAEHLGPACEAYDLESDDLANTIGAEHFMNLWGCAFEDLITLDFDGCNFAEDYLKRRGWKETAMTRAYIRALRSSVMSLYEISGIRRDEGFFARDLLRAGEPVWVSEKMGTHYLEQWDHVGARVLTVNGRTQMGGGLLRFRPKASGELIVRFEEVAASISGNAASAGKPDMESALAKGAFAFSTVWLADTLSSLLEPPQAVNTDGEPIEWVELCYPLARGTKQADIAAALASVAGLRAEGRKFWNWVEEGQQPGGPSGSRGGPEDERSTVFLTRMGDGAMVLGTLELKGRTLTLSVNSQGRARRGRELVEARLGDLVGAPRIESRTLAEMREEKHREETGEEPPAEVLSGLPEEERIALLKSFFNDHYARVLDEPVPMLGDVSPRKAARDEGRRAKAVEWLKNLENHHAHMARQPGGIAYDCGWIWRELELDRDG